MDDRDDPYRWLNFAELGRKLGVKRSAICEFAKQGMPCFEIDGRKRVQWSAFDQWIRAQEGRGN